MYETTFRTESAAAARICASYRTPPLTENDIELRSDPCRNEPESAGAAMSLRWLVSLYRVEARLRCGRSRPPRKE
jgi:hypothetical protein